MCTMFSQLQNVTKWNETKQHKWCEAVKNIQFMIKVYQYQITQGRCFLHEHPAGATSWGLSEVQELMNKSDILTTIADQCMYGLLTNDDKGNWVPAKKKTRFMTNSQAIAEELNKKCDRTHEHQHLMSGRAADAARYPKGL